MDYHFTKDKFTESELKATPHKERLTALQAYRYDSDSLLIFCT